LGNKNAFANTRLNYYIFGLVSIFLINVAKIQNLLYLKIINLFVYFIGEVGCSYCGGLGHRITDCPKLEALQTKQAQNIGRRDYLATGSADY
jgi:hypothetical protein